MFSFVSTSGAPTSGGAPSEMGTALSITHMDGHMSDNVSVTSGGTPSEMGTALSITHSMDRHISDNVSVTSGRDHSSISLLYDEEGNTVPGDTLPPQATVTPPPVVVPQVVAPADEVYVEPWSYKGPRLF